MDSKKVYVKLHAGGAGRWIYEGYFKAWKNLNYEVAFYNSLDDIRDAKDTYILMAIDGDVNTQSRMTVVENSYKTFLYAQPNEFPKPWGTHPNFKCMCPVEFIDKLNGIKNVYLWSFGNTSDFHTLWKGVHHIPLAFDNLSYKNISPVDKGIDVCFVGGWADNGFDEKRKLLIEHFQEFEGAGLTCAIFVNQGLSHEKETNIMYNSKVALNIHDAYQRVLGLDTNERTFKSLGTTGVLVSDDIKCLDDFDFKIVRENDPKKYLEAVMKYIFDTPEDELHGIREYNINEIMENHTYTHRVNSLMAL